MGTDTKGKMEVDEELWRGQRRLQMKSRNRFPLVRASMRSKGAYNRRPDHSHWRCYQGRPSWAQFRGRSDTFDGTGVGLQDLAVASVAARLALRQRMH